MPEANKEQIQVTESIRIIKNQCPGGEIGRHAGLRNQCGNAWEFESLLGHQTKFLIVILNPLNNSDLNTFLLIIMNAYTKSLS